MSHQINPEAREYERTSTTVLSASVMKPVSDYLDSIDNCKPRDKDLYFFHSAGGMVPPSALKEMANAIRGLKSPMNSLTAIGAAMVVVLVMVASWSLH